MYVLQLIPNVRYATWPGFWAGMGYVDDPKRAIRFWRKKDAVLAASASFIGLNDGLRIVRYKDAIKK
jgi:hypothetical protein